jgi:hypothetical protein
MRILVLDLPAILVLGLQYRRLSKKLHCNNRLMVFPSPAGMSLIKLSLAVITSRPGIVWQVTFRLGKGKLLTFFYSLGVLNADVVYS